MVPERSFILIDAQNIVGAGIFELRDAKNARNAIDTLIEPSNSDLVVVATGAKTVFHIADAWPTARHLVGRGKNGADYALQERIKDTTWVTDRFNHLYLASGDHEFIQEIECFCKLSFPVTIIGRAGSIFQGYYDLGVEVLEIDGDWDLAA